jgi:N-acetylneuraminic acid mutarotase
LSDLGAAVVGSHVYLVGGYTGTRFASAVLRYLGAGRTKVAARLPAGLRYAGVAAIGNTIYVAGGLTTSGETADVFAVTPSTGQVRRIGALPEARAYGALVAYRGSLLLVGGKSGTGTATSQILRIDPASGNVTPAGALPQPLAEPAAVARSGDVVVVGGEGSRAVYSIRG